MTHETAQTIIHILSYILAGGIGLSIGYLMGGGYD